MSTLSLIIACRHGDYHNDHLTDTGRKQSLELARGIHGRLNGDGGKVLLVTSPASRAVETAEIIGKQLGVRSQYLGCLEIDMNAGGRQKKDLERLVEGHTIVIAVTHFESPSEIIDAFSRANDGDGFPIMTIPKGTALCLSFEAKHSVVELP